VFRGQNGLLWMQETDRRMMVSESFSDHPCAATRPLSLRGTSPPDLRRGA